MSTFTCLEFTQVSVFDLTSGEEKVLAEIGMDYFGFASILVEKSIYVFGGNNIFSSPLNSCER